jgi:hypothetical protein
MAAEAGPSHKCAPCTPKPVPQEHALVHCGCKGVRSCLVCEQDQTARSATAGLAKAPTLNMPAQVHTMCPLCHRLSLSSSPHQCESSDDDLAVQVCFWHCQSHTIASTEFFRLSYCDRSGSRACMYFLISSLKMKNNFY